MSEPYCPTCEPMRQIAKSRALYEKLCNLHSAHAQQWAKEDASRRADGVRMLTIQIHALEQLVKELKDRLAKLETE